MVERIPGDTAQPRALGYRLGIESAIDRLLLCVTNDIVVEGALETLAENPPPAVLPIKGGELIEMGVTEGPDVARSLRAIEDAWIAEDIPDQTRIRQVAAKLLKASPNEG